MTISPYNLVQEQQLGQRHEAWRILVVCALLNRTHGRQVRPIVDSFFRVSPTPAHVLYPTRNSHDRMYEILKPLGLVLRRIEHLQGMSLPYHNTCELHGDEWYKQAKNGDWALKLPGCGQYAADSLNLVLYDIDVPSPADTWLSKYAEWKRGAKEHDQTVVQPIASGV